MSELVITISITIPDGAQVTFAKPTQQIPPQTLDDLPFPEPPHHADTPLQQAVAVFADLTGRCPVHNVTWKVVPAGVSKKTGKPYTDFMACPTTGCNEKPR